MKSSRYIFIAIGLAFVAWLSMAGPVASLKELDLDALLVLPQDTPKNDTTKPYKRSAKPTVVSKDRRGDSFSNQGSTSPLELGNPSNITTTVEMDSINGTYTIYEKIGEIDYRPPTIMTFEEYSRYQQQRSAQQYWRSKAATLDGESALTSRNLIPKIYISPAFDRIFGGNFVDIRPNGSVMLDFGGQFQRTANPSLPVRQQRAGTFLFDQQIALNVVGKIGEKLQLTANWDTKASFDFENNIRLEYTGFDNEIIRKIEAGNVSLPINSGLITGAQNLFGAKTQLQFGRLSVTAIASNQRGRAESLQIKGGAQRREFEIRADKYEDNRHFFLSHFFRDRYESVLKTIPVVTSGVNITRVEVYMTNRVNNTQTLRNIVGITDLGETHRKQNPALSGPVSATPEPVANGANPQYRELRNNAQVRSSASTSGTLEGLGYTRDTDFSFLRGARQLEEGRDFTVNRQLGYISLTTPLRNDDMISVAFEYTFNGQPYKVGELREDYQSFSEDQTLILKLISPPTIQTRITTWDLMMKNIYFLEATQIARDNFQLRVIYKDDASGVDNPSLHEGSLKDIPLLRVMNLDRLNQNSELQPDGNFDFIEDITIDSRNGRVIFPILEPFGSHLASQFRADEQLLINKYAYTELYDSTKADALLNANKNKFFLRGSLQSSSSNEIMLPGINIAEGSVVVTAGGVPLLEGQQYTVDYGMGRVRIIDDGILNSNQEISIRYEKADMFNFQPKTLFGTRAEYKVNNDFIIGGTMLHMNERPILTRVSIGDEPTRNTIWGLDLNYRRESRFLTKMVDFLPLIQTKEISTINFTGEFAQLQPGSSRFLGKGGQSYIDDFEGSETAYDLTRQPTTWALAAVPEARFGPAPDNTLRAGDRRAKLAWYSIDNLFYRNIARIRPPNISEEDLKYHYVRGIGPQEVFPNRSLQVVNLNQYTFDLAYYPTERGPYNYNTNLGSFKATPADNWGGITRAINNSDTDFDNANIQYIEFWMMDPFIQNELGRVATGDGTQGTNNTTGGQLYINLGSVSEDVLKDDRHAFENGMPTPNQAARTDTTAWGRVPGQQQLTRAFDNTAGSRQWQDIGLDGLNSENEKAFFRNYLNQVNGLSPEERDAIMADPSGDDFRYYLGTFYDERNAKILERYKNFNNPEGNSPEVNSALPYNPSYHTIPDNEDLNLDNTINKLEAYFEYKIDLKPSFKGGLQVGQGYVVDKVVPAEHSDVTWYQFRIPIRDLNAEGARKVGNINDFKSIRFMRMYMTGFSEPVVLRFVQMQMVASQWRVFNDDLQAEEGQFKDEDKSVFSLSRVNIEENSQGGQDRTPYVTPPGVIRDRDNTAINNRLLNEQSLSMCVENLNERDAKAVFKNVSMDFINYKRLRMFVHAESRDVETRDNETSLFMRIGTDFTENYYEIEIPLKLTPIGSTSDPYEIWPQENEIDIPFDLLYQVKAMRDGAEGPQRDLRIPYPYNGLPVEGTKQLIRVKGRPDLSAVRTIMMGLKNPRSSDRMKKSVCVWVNELRVSDFDKNSGWAATGRLNTKLADFATVTAAGRYATIGFGSIDQRISQRLRADVANYNVSSNITLDKFLPASAGIRVPMFISYDRQLSTPQFSPFDPDMPLESAIRAQQDPELQARYRAVARDNTVRRSLNFTNIQKTRMKEGAVPRLWDIENISLTYAYFDEVNTSPFREEYLFKTYMGALGYNYTANPKSIEPFAKVKAFDSPYMKLFRDINFTPLPSNLAFRGELNRRFMREQLRGSNFLEQSTLAPTYEKAFLFNRVYNMRWMLTKALTLDYNANVQALIMEPDGEITEENRQVVIDNLKSLGRTKVFDQRIELNYRLPFDKFPLTDFVSADIRYAGGFIWTAAPLGLADADSNQFGNNIQNNRERAVNGRIDMLKLYNKVKFLNEINNPKPKRPANQPVPNQGRPAPGQPAIAAKDSTEKKPRELKLLKGVLRSLMTARTLNFTYALQEGTQLPDYLPNPDYFGANFTDFAGAPGFPFILGSQDPDIRRRAGESGWLGNSPMQNRPFSQSQTERITAMTNLEPIRDFRIQLNISKTKTSMYNEIYVYSDTLGRYQSQSPNRNGNYNITFNTIRTAFSKRDGQNITEVFHQFAQNRQVMLDRLTAENPSGEGQYSLNSQDVLIPSFIAAYSGRDINKANKSSFPSIPLPNWRIDYAGLNKIGWFKENLRNVTLTHAYTSTYAVGNYASSLLYGLDYIGMNINPERYITPSRTGDVNEGATPEWVPIFILSQVAIQERFSPLVGVNIRTKGNITIKVDYNRDRSVALNTSNAQVTEINNQDIVVGLGFQKAGLVLPIRSQGRNIVLKNQLDFRTDVTVRDNRTTQRLFEGVHQVTNGGLDFLLRPTLNYVINQRFNLTSYFERTINQPRVSTSFRRNATRFGIQLRINLS